MTDVIERVEASWRNLLDAFEGIPDERMSDPGAADDWSVKDVMAHVAYWDGAAIGIVERKLSESPDPERDESWDYEPINQAEHAARSGWSLETVRQELFGTHERLLAALRRVPYLDPEVISGDTWEHYDEHAQGIRAWRDRAGI